MQLEMVCTCEAKGVREVETGQATTWSLDLGGSGVEQPDEVTVEKISNNE
jgi:hypothetical protein